MVRNNIKLLAIPLLILVINNCAYYNTFYNAKKAFNKGYEETEKRRFERFILTSEDKPENDTRNRPTATEKQNYQKAIEKASAVLKFYPNSKYVDDALMLLGQAFFYQEDYQKAKRKFEELLTNYPDGDYTTSAKLWLAKTNMEMKNFEEAETQLHQLLTNEKIDRKIMENAQIMLGDLYFNKENYLVAADVYKRATSITHDKEMRTWAFMRLGESYLKLQEYPEAIEAYRVAVKKSPNNDFKNNAMYNQGLAESENGQYDQAIKTFSKLLTGETNLERIPMVKLQIAENIRFKGNIDEAMDWYKSIIEEHKRTNASARSYYAIGLVKEQAAKYKEAKENFENVRAEYSRSEIIDDAKRHADDIAKMLQLEDEIALLEGRKIETKVEEENKEGKQTIFSGKLDANLILLARKYEGRPEPRRLLGAAPIDENLDLTGAVTPLATDSTMSDSTRQILTQKVKSDSVQKFAKARDLAGKKFQLAELLLFQFNQYDSALAQYRDILANAAAEELYPLALYSIAYMKDEILNNQKTADSIYHILVERYPDTPHANAAREKLELPIKDISKERYKDIFQTAENKFWDDEDSEAALELFQTIIDSFPDCNYVPKAKFAQAWILENDLKKMDKAQDLYRDLVENYNATDYAKKAKPKLDAIKKHEQMLAARMDSIANAKAKAASKDSTLTPAAIPDSSVTKASDPNLATTPISPKPGMQDSTTPTDQPDQKASDGSEATETEIANTEAGLKEEKQENEINQPDSSKNNTEPKNKTKKSP